MNISTGFSGGLIMISVRVSQLCSVLAALLISASHAAEVVWTLPAGDHRQSTAVALSDRFYFEVGGFADGFVPSATNFGEWAGKWTALSRQGYSPGSATLAQGAVLDGMVEGELGYVWGYNVDDPVREWVLLTDSSWTWPAADVAWSVTASTTALLGQWNGSTLTTAPVGLAEDPVITPQEWRASLFVAPALLNNPLISGWNADPDGDGLENLLEMALGTHPLLISPPNEGLPEGTTSEVSGMVLPGLAFKKRPELLLGYDVTASEGASVTVIRDSLREIVVHGDEPLANRETQFLTLSVSLLNED